MMSKPRLRPLEVFPLDHQGERLVAFRDPQGFTETAVMPYAAGMLASLLDGRRTLADVQRDFQNHAGQQLPLADLERFVRRLDEAYLLDSPRFAELHQREVQGFLDQPTRKAAHAGGAYAGEPAALREQLSRLFTCDDGPGPPDFNRNAPADGPRLRGVLSPHIDLHRGGPAFAWAYKRVLEESVADTYVIFGTAHNPMRSLFSVLRKDFETPLGTVEVDRALVDRLAAAAAREPAVDLFVDDLAHRHEHSIEFQVVFLQYLLGERRPFRILPILTGSFHPFVQRQQSPRDAPPVARFVQAMREAEAGSTGRVFYISGGDLAHVGQRFGDPHRLQPDHLAALEADDRALLAEACRADAQAFFHYVARQQDRNRICGLSPTYTLLEVVRPSHGELLKYAQATAEDGSSCVSFASVAFYGGD